MEQITPKDLEKLKDRLNINVSDSVSALKSIIKIDNHNNLDDLFYKYFFVSNSKIKEQEHQLYKSFDDDCQFKIVHGYSKNGKTTFINHILYKHRIGEFKKSEYFDHLKLIDFDFEKTKAGGFIEKVKSIYKRIFFNTELDDRKTINKTITSFNSFISQFQQVLNTEKQYTQADIVDETFTSICHYFNIYLENTNYGDHGDNYFVAEKFKENVTSLIDKNNCGDFFIYLILFKIFKHRDEIICKEKCKIIFTLDNIDDYLENRDISFFQHPQIHLSTFLHEMSHNDYISKVFISELSKFSTKKVKNLHFSFQNQLAIVYVFRTANFLVFANLIQKYREDIATSGERHFSDLLLDKEYIHYKTVGNTSAIFDLRLKRFFEIAKKLEMQVPTGYLFLKTLSDNFDSSKTEKHERNIRRIFNLWNGDKNALWKSIITNWSNIEKHYLNNEIIIKSLENQVVNQEQYRYLLKGIYVNFFLYLLHNNSTLKDLLKHAIYSFRDNHHVEKKKNIRRIIVNYVINNTIKSGRPTCLNQVNLKGVGLYDLLNEIDIYINKVNSKSDNGEIYNFEELVDYFKELCTTKIDHFGQLFSIYKDQIITTNGETVNSSYYNLNTEIALFIEHKEDCRQELNKVRIYHNNNSAYISASLLTNYELYSYVCLPNGVEKLPLLFKLNKKYETIRSEKDFQFYDTIEQVYNDAERSVTTMIDFYCNYLIDLYPPDEFIKSPLFSVKNPDNNDRGDFQFRLIISRHITYLEAFRQIALNHSDKIIHLKESDKVIINKYLVNTIIKYCRLYCKSYDRIKEIEIVGDHNPIQSSYIVYHRFIKLGTNILENDISNFNPIE